MAAPVGVGSQKRAACLRTLVAVRTDSPGVSGLPGLHMWKNKSHYGKISGTNSFMRCIACLRCDKCHRTFPVLDLFLEHKVTHYRTFDCFICKKSYTAKKSLQNHMQTHVKGHSRIDLCSADNGEETKLNLAFDSDDYELSEFR